MYAKIQFKFQRHIASVDWLTCFIDTFTVTFLIVPSQSFIDSQLLSENVYERLFVTFIAYKFMIEFGMRDENVSAHWWRGQKEEKPRIDEESRKAFHNIIIFVSSSMMPNKKTRKTQLS